MYSEHTEGNSTSLLHFLSCVSSSLFTFLWTLFTSYRIHPLRVQLSDYQYICKAGQDHQYLMPHIHSYCPVSGTLLPAGKVPLQPSNLDFRYTIFSAWSPKCQLRSLELLSHRIMQDFLERKREKIPNGFISLENLNVMYSEIFWELFCKLRTERDRTPGSVFLISPKWLSSHSKFRGPSDAKNLQY